MHLEMAAFRLAAKACDAHVPAESSINSAIKSILAIFMFPSSFGPSYVFAFGHSAIPTAMSLLCISWQRPPSPHVASVAAIIVRQGSLRVLQRIGDALVRGRAQDV
jgi:hypothetical protein